MRKRQALVIGGGASGLVTARGLAQKGWNVVLLEAKARLGGRIFTRNVQGSVVELGAEFVHGNSAAMKAALNEAQLKVIDAAAKNRLAGPAGFKEVDLWERVGNVLGHIKPHGSDVAFKEWLASAPVDAESKEMALSFVEGFNASDARVIGAHALLRAEFESQKSGGDKQSRVHAGYNALVEALHNAATQAGVEIVTGARVRLVKWVRGKVSVKTEDSRDFESELAVVTLPLGALKSGRVVFEPSLVHKVEAIDSLKFGNVAKLIYVFRHRWWKDAGLEEDFGFVHAFDEPIPTWWSDSRSPVLIGWAAGPKGDAMLNLTGSQLRSRGIEIMARVFSRRAPEIEADLAGYDHYDWRADPDVGGAYSYIPVNGLDLPKALGAPVEETLFFAGEATAMDAQMGTVTGAIESGLRVVAEIY